MCELVDDADPCSVWRSVTRKARKVHRCSVCRSPIAVGVRHQEVNAMARESGWQVRAHLACARFTERWQLDVCGQRSWTLWPDETPHRAILGHVRAGDIGAAEAVSAWLAWMRERHAEDPAASGRLGR